MAWHVYLLRCTDGSLYAGITTDLERRLAEHNLGKAGAKYTRSRRPVVLVWSEAAEDRGAASRREYALKKLGREAKEELLRIAASAALRD
jgi:putative endonuclease